MTQPNGSGMPTPVTIIPVVNESQFSVTPQIVPILTPTVGGYNPDVEGNNAYFNNLVIAGSLKSTWRLLPNSTVPNGTFTDTVDGNSGNSWHVDIAGCQLIGGRYYSAETTPLNRNFAWFHAGTPTPLYQTTILVNPGWNEWPIPAISLIPFDLYWSVTEQIPGKKRVAGSGQWNIPEVGGLNADGCGFLDGTFPQIPTGNCGQDWLGHDVVVTGPDISIPDGSITTAKLADGAVTGQKIAYCTVTNHNLATDVFRNPLLVNGGLRISQRGTNFSTPATGTTTLDRWKVSFTAGSFPNISLTNALTPYGVNANISGASGQTTYGGSPMQFWQAIQFADGNLFNLRSKTVTFAIWLSASAGSAAAPFISSDGTGGSNVIGTPVGANVWQRVFVTYTIPIDATQVTVGVWFTASCTWACTEATLVVGDVPEDYQPLTAADDLARCLRYYQLWAPQTNWPEGTGMCVSTVAATIFKYLKAPMAITPVITFSPVGFWALWSATGALIPVTSMAVWTNQPGDVFFTLNLNVASGLVAGNATQLVSNAAGAYMQAEANP